MSETKRKNEDREGRNEAWMVGWLDAVKDGRATMSQRSKKSVEARGGLAMAASAAKARGVHLVELTDDRGNKLIAASRHPFKTIC